MKSESTTIKISKETKKRLDNFREYNAESYEELIKKMLYILNTVRKNPELGKSILNSIDKNIKRKLIINKELSKELTKGASKEFKQALESSESLQ
jgi:hypothetical protein